MIYTIHINIYPTEKHSLPKDWIGFEVQHNKGMSVPHRVNAPHENMQCIMDSSLYFFILVCNKYIKFHFYMGVFISYQIAKKVFLFGTEKLFWDDQYILGNDSEHSSSA